MAQVKEKQAKQTCKIKAEQNRQQKSRDVLILTNQDKVFCQIQKFLEDKRLGWDKLSIDGFFINRDVYDFIGTVVVETSAVKPEQKNRICEIIRSLEADGIASVLINNHINFPIGNYDLVSVLDTGSIEELQGRIIGNIAYRKKLNKVNELVEDNASEEMEEQLRMAGQVQRDFLPAKLPDTKQVKWSVLFQPADWVSGDIYDAQRLDEQHIGFYVADAVGHSMPAALLTMFLKQALVMRQTTGSDYRIFGPGEVMTNLNRKMVEQELSGSLFVTCCYCLLNTRTLQLTYSRAGHPYPILIKKDNSLELLQARGGLLGVFENSEFATETVQLEPGDRLMLYSDGAEPVVGDTQDNGEFVFTEDFKSITELGVEKMIEMFDIIIRNRCQDFLVQDDITALGLEIL